jgi:hypothetical protein
MIVTVQVWMKYRIGKAPSVIKTLVYFEGMAMKSWSDLKFRQITSLAKIKDSLCAHFSAIGAKPVTIRKDPHLILHET